MIQARPAPHLPAVPYPGIEPFGYDRADVFFAREDESRALLRLITIYRGALLYAESGTGKSSLINAGLMPLAVDEGLTPERVRVHPRPGEEFIVERIADGQNGGRPLPPSVFGRDQERKALSAAAFLDALRNVPGEVRPLLIFDQFEEWVTLFEEGTREQSASDLRAAQDRIRDAIATLINDPTLRVKVLISLREDYLARLTPLFRLCPRLPDQYLRLRPLSGDQIERAIRGPFEAYPGHYQPELSASLAKEIRRQFEAREGAPVQLTEVQIVCQSLFEAGLDGTDPEAFFTRHKGVRGILERYSAEALASLDEAQRDPAIALLERMITSAGTRNVISGDDLVKRAESEDHIAPELLAATLEDLDTNSKLIRRERRREVYFYEISSEFLVDWIRTQARHRRERMLEQRRLEAEARARDEKQRADRQARLARRFANVSIALAVVMVLAAIAGVIAWQKQREAQEQRQLAETQTQAAEEARQLAEAQRQLAEEQRGRAQETERRRTEELFQSQLTHAALLANGEEYARAREVLDQSRELDAQIAPERRHGRDFLARYVEMMGGGAQQAYEGAGAPLLSVAVSPDGNLLAAVGEKGTVVLFDVANGLIRQRLEGHAGDVLDAAFDPEGAWLVTGADDGQIIRWSLPTGDAQAKQLQAWEAPDQVWAVAVSPDGRLLATGGPDNDISVWQAETGELVRRLEGHEDAIAEGAGLAFSPSGQRLASASYDREARVWEVETGESLQVLGGHNDVVSGVTFAANDNYIATTSGSGDRRTILWDVESGRPVRAFAEHANAVFGIGYLAGRAQPAPATAAGQETRPRLVTGSFDRTLKVLDMDTGATLRVLEGHFAGVTSIAVHTPKESGTAPQVFSASNDGTARRWDMAPLPHQYVIDLPGEAWAAAVAPNGAHVAVGFDTGSLRLYTLPDGRLVADVEGAHGAGVQRLVFDAEGTVLASASHDTTAKLWSVAGDGELTLQETFTGHADSVYGIAVSPDGKTLATASYDGRVGLFEVGAKDEGRFIDAHDGMVESVAFDTGGTRLLSAGYEDKTARLWDLTTDPPALIRNFSGAQDMLLWAALSPDDRLLATVGRDQVVYIHKADDGQLLRHLVGHEQTVVRAAFSPDSTQLATVSSDATVRLWNADTGAQLFALRLPADRVGDPLWDFDFRCTPTGCWVAVPLTRGMLALYDLGPYAE